MKTVYLLRHSEPDKTSRADNAQIPLSENGKRMAQILFQQIDLPPHASVFSSPYARAYETASLLGCPVIADSRLIERKIGSKETFSKELWARQYTDCDCRNADGESFRIVRNRMTAAMADILTHTEKKSASVVVSHAAAICAYLQQFCTIEVTNADRKLRNIQFRNQTVLDGAIGTPSCFRLEFEGHQLRGIEYLSVSKLNSMAFRPSEPDKDVQVWESLCASKYRHQHGYSAS